PKQRRESILEDKSDTCLHELSGGSQRGRHVHSQETERHSRPNPRNGTTTIPGRDAQANRITRLRFAEPYHPTVSAILYASQRGHRIGCTLPRKRLPPDATSCSMLFQG